MKQKRAQLAAGKETYEEKRLRLRIPPGETPGPVGSYRSFTAENGVSVSVIVTWFVGLGWYFSTEVWNLKALLKDGKADEKGLYLTRDIPMSREHWKFGPEFWKCVAAGEAHARKLVALFGGPFPEQLEPYGRVDGAFSDDPPRKEKR